MQSLVLAIRIVLCPAKGLVIRRSRRHLLEETRNFRTFSI
jgi:hypothetical protein